MRYGRADVGSKSLSATMGTKMSLLNGLGAVNVLNKSDSKVSKSALGQKLTPGG